MPESTLGILNFLFASLLAAAHILGPKLYNHLRTLESGTAEAAFTSFGGGIAIAYVFLELIPELSAGHHHALAFVAFLLVLCMERIAAGKSGGNEDDASYPLRLMLIFLYTALTTATFHKHGELGAARLAIFVVAVLLHTLGSGHALHHSHAKAHSGYGRFVLAAGAFAGGGFALYWPPEEELIGVLIAALAGFLLRAAFSKELAAAEDSRAFFTGAVLFGLVLLWLV